MSADSGAINAPGQNQIAFSPGRQNEILARMTLALPLAPVGDQRPLAKLSLNPTGNAALALLDAWAMLVDILGFYQERIANEGYLRTALESLSLLQLARSVGYSLRGPLSASALLVFTVSDEEVLIPAGSAVRSLPAANGLPLTYETADDFTARLEWNSIRPLISQTILTQSVSSQVTELVLVGRPSGLAVGQILLCQDALDGRWFRFLIQSTASDSNGQNLVATGVSLGPDTSGRVYGKPVVSAFRDEARLFGASAPEWSAQPPAVQQRVGIAPRALYTLSPEATSWSQYAQISGLPFVSTRALTFCGNSLLIGGPQGIFGSIPWAPGIAGLSDLDVRTLYYDGTNLFAGCGTGLFRSANQGRSWTSLTTGAITITRTETGQPAGNVTSVTGMPKTATLAVLTYNQTLFAGTQSGLYLSMIDPIQWSLAETSGGTLGSVVSALAIHMDPKKQTTRVYAAAADGVYSADLTKKELTFSLETLPEQPSGFTSAVSTSTGVYAGSENAGTFFLADGGSWTPAPPAQGDTSAYLIYRTLATGIEAVYFVTTNHIYRSISGQPPVPIGSPPGITLALAADASGTLYAGTSFIGPPDSDWPGITIAPGSQSLALDAVYPDIFPQTGLLLESSTSAQVNTIVAAQAETVTGFNQSARVTMLKLDAALTPFAGQNIRDFEVYGGFQSLGLAARPVTETDPVQGSGLECVRLKQPPAPGQTIILSGRRVRLSTPDLPRVTRIETGSGAIQPAGLQGEDVLCLSLQAGQLYAGTFRDLFTSPDKGATWQATGLAREVSSIILISKSGRLLAAAGDGVYFTSTSAGPNWIWTRAGGFDTKPPVHCFLLASDGALYAGADDGLYQCRAGDGATWESIGSPGAPIRSLAEAPFGALWVGAESGLYLYEHSGGSSQWSVAGLVNLSVQFLLISAGSESGVMYAATMGGVFRSPVPGDLIEELDLEPFSAGLGSLDVRALTIAPGAGDLYAATPGGIYRAAPQDESWALYYSGIANNYSALLFSTNDLVVAARRESLLTDSGGGQAILFVGESPIVCAPGLNNTSVPGNPTHWLVQNFQGFSGWIYAGETDRASLIGAEPDDPVINEICVVAGSADQENSTQIKLAAPLANVYDRSSVNLLANTTLATEGRTVADEALGSGNAALAYQTFSLSKAPLTYVSAASASGEEGELSVRVNGVEWQATGSLSACGPNDQVYLVRSDAQGKTWILFGDGIHGARLPNGLENVRARYRYGGGAGGNLDAGTLILPVSRPQGLKSVTNPLPASGGVDAENLDIARTAPPRSLLVMDRIVSLPDYENFAQNFPGVSKAQATRLWTESGSRIFLTIGGVDGAAIPAGSEIQQNLIAAMDALRALPLVLVVESYEPVPFNTTAKITIKRSATVGAVQAAVNAALLAAFSFASQSFVNTVAASAITSTIQEVEDVLSVDLLQLYVSGANPEFNSLLAAQPARWQAGVGYPAQMLLLHNNSLEFVQ